MALKPPAYTDIEPSTVKGGDLRVIEGTDATFRIAFDSPPAEASLVMTDPSVRSRKDKAAPAPQVIPLKSDGTAYTAGLKLTKGLVFQIDARTADGRALPENRYKIDVLEDRAPRVSFEQPDEALEVHPIAEILNRIRVGDDFGLTRAGIVFQFNNGDEQTLIVKDFTAEPAKARTTARTPGDAAPGEARRLADGQPDLLRLRRGQLPGRCQADRDRPALPRHPPVQARVQDGRIRATDPREKASSRPWRS